MLRNLSLIEGAYLVVVLPATVAVLKLFYDRVVNLRLQEKYDGNDPAYLITARILVASTLGSVVSLIFFSIIGILVALAPTQSDTGMNTRQFILTCVLFSLVLVKCVSVFYVFVYTNRLEQGD